MASTKEEDLKEIRLLIDFYEAKLQYDSFLLDVSTKVLLANTIKWLRSIYDKV